MSSIGISPGFLTAFPQLELHSPEAPGSGGTPLGNEGGPTPGRTSDDYFALVRPPHEYVPTAPASISAPKVRDPELVASVLAQIPAFYEAIGFTPGQWDRPLQERIPKSFFPPAWAVHAEQPRLEPYLPAAPILPSGDKALWAPSMSREEADAWVKSQGTAFSMPAFHGAPPEHVREVLLHGFDLSRHTNTHSGVGVSLALTHGAASRYALSGGSVLETRQAVHRLAEVSDHLLEEFTGQLRHWVAHRLAEIEAKNPFWESFAIRQSVALQFWRDVGVDALLVKSPLVSAAGDHLIVLDPKRIVVIDPKPVYGP